MVIVTYPSKLSNKSAECFMLSSKKNNTLFLAPTVCGKNQTHKQQKKNPSELIIL